MMNDLESRIISVAMCNTQNALIASKRKKCDIFLQETFKRLKLNCEKLSHYAAVTLFTNLDSMFYHSLYDLS